jgi:hypothetical protein
MELHRHDGCTNFTHLLSSGHISELCSSGVTYTDSSGKARKTLTIYFPPSILDVLIQVEDNIARQ